MTRATRFGRAQGYATGADAEICLLVHVETPKALARIEEIAAMDCLFMGPADLAGSMGLIGRAGHKEVVAAVEDAIRRIDRETRGRFKDTFDRVNSGVQALYPRLFGGGHAYLELTGDDLLDTGVAIMARPPGKRVSNISLLSGGERSLTALAYLFAVFRARPSPFYVMDEVEAALDDVNLHRFLDLVHEFREEAQLIIVSHQKRTMEAADCLYGVTMQPGGSSRVVSEKVDE